jgi:hypothetical protein
LTSIKNEHGRDVARVVQRTIALAGVGDDLGGHSLPAGFVAAAVQKTMPEVGHQSR